jgi:hypothetical protein
MPGFQAGNAVRRAEQPRDRHELALQRNRGVVTAGARQLEQAHACIGRGAAERENAADCADAQGWIERRGRAGQHAEAIGRARHEVGHLRDVAARFLHPDDVRMRRQTRHRGRQQIHAGERGEVVEENRHRRRVGDRRVVTHERVVRHLHLEKTGRAHEHRVRAVLRRALARLDRGLRRLAAGADDEPLLARHDLARGDDHLVGFEVVQQHRFAVRPEDDEAVQRPLHPFRERRAQPRGVDAIAIVEGRRNGGEDSGKIHPAIL